MTCSKRMVHIWGRLFCPSLLDFLTSLFPTLESLFSTSSIILKNVSRRKLPFTPKLSQKDRRFGTWHQVSAPLEIDKIRTDQCVVAYGIDIRYNELTSEEFQGNLRKHMSDITALDFAEQLLIFRDFGMIYERPEFVQANQVSIISEFSWGITLLTWVLLSCLD